MSGSRPPMSGGGPRGPGFGLGFTLAGRGTPMSFGPPTVVNSVEVPHFELREDPSFWMDNNVQVNYIYCTSLAAIVGISRIFVKFVLDACVYIGPILHNCWNIGIHLFGIWFIVHKIVMHSMDKH